MRTTVWIGLASLLFSTPVLAKEKTGEKAAPTASEEKKEKKDDRGKKEVCHVPKGNPKKAKTLSIGADGVAAHLEHGDREGACQREAPAAEIGAPKPQ